jgi:hypothetical protein
MRLLGKVISFPFLIRDEPVDFEVIDVYIKNIYDKRG